MLKRLEAPGVIVQGSKVRALLQGQIPTQRQGD